MSLLVSSEGCSNREVRCGYVTGLKAALINQPFATDAGAFISGRGAFPFDQVVIA